ncbi:iron complex outermembrane receptor protein [Undibacterium sp. GrIS 1.8]|uniref:TonB-dependent receptor n=1 Tax=unclassified Undibacterium TaxID=2630295 RepID=UPI003399A2E7
MKNKSREIQIRPTKIALSIRYALGLSAVLGCVSPSAFAQAEADAAKVQRVEITGSSIKRLDAETAMPLQILTRAEIDKSGVTTAAELLSKISASAAALTDGASFSDNGGTQRGFNGANLRGIGVSSTLILLNGRRLANFASPGNSSGVDLNSIPAAAISRVEVLKDGASAIYGTDAIGGVINFITRPDYQGAEVSAYTGGTQHGGAGKNIVTLSGGLGDLTKDRYNVMAVVNVQDSQSLRSTQRDWIGSAYQPDINLDVSSSNTYPANVRRTKASGSATGSRLNPSAPNCNPPSTVYAPGSFVGSQACLYDYMHDTEIFPESKRFSLLSRGQYALNDDTTLFAEVLHSDTKTTYRISPLTVSDLNYPLPSAGGIYYPSSLITTNQTPLRVGLRLSEAGPRTNEVDAVAQRIVLGAKGSVAGWDYDTALNHSVSTVDDKYVNGYVRTSLFNAAFLSGKINPFGPSGADGLALLNAAKISDAARHSRGTTDSLDAKASRELFDMAGGKAAVAVGAEYRREKLDFTPSALLAAGEIRGDGAAAAYGGDRDVKAIYAEFNFPVLKNVETQFALRHDRYNDVGGTTNPKVGIRWNPTKEIIFRGSYGTGFRAPTLTDLHEPARVGQTSGVYNDPLGCIKVGAIDNTKNPDYCGIQPNLIKGGTADLKPETSKQYSFGFVFEPMRTLTTSIDYWRIQKSDTLLANEGAYFSDPTHNSAYVVRAAADPTLPGIPGAIVSVDGRTHNIGTLDTSGIDLNVNWRLPANDIGKFAVSLNGTYVFDYKTKTTNASPEINGVGVFTDTQVVQRWRHTLTFDFDRGPWGATVQQTFYQGYQDQNPNPDGSVRRVGSYALWDMSGSYKLSNATSFRVGIKNLLDTNPPRSNQVYSFLAGYDPSYTDPRGRFFYASVNYAFK